MLSLWDQVTRDTFISADAVINLTGENVGAKRWTAAVKKEIITSRTGSTKLLAGLLADLGAKAPPLYNASAIGIYGLQKQLPDRLPDVLDESTPLHCDQPTDFLMMTGCRWEQAAEPAVKAGVRVVFLRFGVVLAKEGGALPKLMKPFQYYLGGPLGSGNQPFSWVAIDDVVSAIDFLVKKSDASGPYNIVAPECVRQGMFAETLSAVMYRPDLVRVPGFMLRLMLGNDMADGLLLEGQRVYPKRLLEAGFKFSYPDIESALNRVL